MKKNILRILGYVFSAILIVLCILLVIAASLFGSKKTVDIFGSNIYLVETDDIPTAPKGSAVFVKRSTAADLDTDKLVLYLKADADDAPTLGYVKDITARDGVSYLSVTYKDALYEFPESKLVGRADYSSVFFGGLIGFIKTPLGVMVVAILPCAALILFEIARTISASRPEPEVEPKFKNSSEERPHTDIKLSVDTEGKASYARDRSHKPLPKDSSVLFNYAGKQNNTKKDVPINERPIIPLTDKKPAARTDNKLLDTGLLHSADTAADTERPSTEIKKLNPAAIRPEPKTPLNVSANRSPQNYEGESSEKTSEKTAELPLFSKRADNDAFFAQPSVGKQSVPQIGRTRSARADDSDEFDAPRPYHAKAEKTSGKRSTQILASKGLNDLFSDDDENAYSKNAGDRAVDEILAGLNRKK